MGSQLQASRGCLPQTRLLGVWEECDQEQSHQGYQHAVQKVSHRPRKDLIQSPLGLGARDQAWLRTGTVSEGWQKEATVCLPYLRLRVGSPPCSHHQKPRALQSRIWLADKQVSAHPQFPGYMCNAVLAVCGSASALWSES